MSEIEKKFQQALGNIAEVREVLAGGAPSGKMILQATRRGDVEAIRLLLEAGVNANYVERSIYGTAVGNITGCSSDIGEIEYLLRLLIRYGGDIDVKDAWGDTALYRAVCKYHEGEDNELSVIKILLKLGADVHKLGSNGESVLFVATNGHKTSFNKDSGKLQKLINKFPS
jgi:ankyrin repeat protein